MKKSEIIKKEKAKEEEKRVNLIGSMEEGGRENRVMRMREGGRQMREERK